MSKEIIRYANKALIDKFYKNHSEDICWLISCACYVPYPDSHIDLLIKIIIPDKEE